MITIYRAETPRTDEDKEYKIVELRGLSTDEKPTEIGGKYIENGSQYIEMDTGKIYVYDLDNEQWREI